MSTSGKQDKEFLEYVIPSGLLEVAIDCINSNLDPEDVFDTNTLDNWAVDNAYIKEG